MFHLRPHPFKVAEAQRIQQSGSGNSRRTAMSIKVGWCFITSPTCFVLKAVCSETVLFFGHAWEECHRPSMSCHSCQLQLAFKRSRE